MEDNFIRLINVNRIRNWNLMARLQIDQDPAMSFIASWIAFNHVYATYANSFKSDFEEWSGQNKNKRGDKAQVEFFASSKLAKNLLVNLNEKGKSYELSLPVESVLNGHKVPNTFKQSINIFELGSIDLFFVIYQVRNNLFHGSKDPFSSPRDESLCVVLADFLVDLNCIFEESHFS